MQDKGIIDILKVFERRITKLESKVAELEYGHDDVAEYSNGINDVSIGDLSAQTVEYNSLSNHAVTPEGTKLPKIVYNKKTLLHLKQSTTPTPTGGASLMSSSSSPTNQSITAPSMRAKDSVFPPLNSPHSSTNSTKSALHATTTNVRSNSKICDIRNGKVKPRLRVRTTASGAYDRDKNAGEDQVTDSGASDPPQGRVEMRYGLLVRFPPEVTDNVN